MSHHRSPNVESCTRYFKDRIVQMLAEARTNDRYTIPQHPTSPPGSNPPRRFRSAPYPNKARAVGHPGAKFQVVMETDPVNFPVVIGPVLRKSGDRYVTADPTWRAAAKINYTQLTPRRPKPPLSTPGSVLTRCRK